MQGSRPSQSARGINQKLLNLESSQDTVNGVRATLSKSRERINVLECSQETTSRNVETLKTDLHDAVKKSNKNAYLGPSHTSHHRKKTAPIAAAYSPLKHLKIAASYPDVSLSMIPWFVAVHHHSLVSTLRKMKRQGRGCKNSTWHLLMRFHHILFMRYGKCRSLFSSCS